MVFVYKTDAGQKEYDFLGAAPDKYMAWRAYAKPVVDSIIGEQEIYQTRHWINEEGYEIVDFGSWSIFIAYKEDGENSNDES